MKQPLESLEARRMLSASPQTLAAAGFEPIEWQGQTVYAKPGQFIAKLDNVHGRPQEQLQQADAKVKKARPDVKAVKHLGDDGLVLLEAPKHTKAKDLEQQLKKGSADVRTVEPDLAVWADVSANDSYFHLQDGLHNTGQNGGTVDADIDAPEAWDLSTGSNTVVVGVIDSGIDYRHPDLAANVWVNPREVAGNGVDDDGNGYADDVHGYDFFNYDADPMDDNGHGTHVAGTIAAVGNNGTGVTGVSWRSKVIALKFMGADGTGSTSGAIAAVNYATKLKTQFGVDVRVTNNSWGSSGYTTALYDAVRNSGAAGQIFVAAAGNGGSDGVGDNNDSTANYPSNFNLANVIAVAAADRNDVLGSFSNYGATHVDLAAPGVNVASTWLNGGYVYSNGTSMASPHVAGVAALAFSAAPNASSAAVRDALLQGADKKASLTGKVATGGRLNALNTLQQLLDAAAPVTPTVPTSPSGLTAQALSRTQVQLAWADKAGDELGYKIERSLDGGQTWTQVATVGGNATTYTDSSLRKNTAYTFRVRAYNTAGNSGYSNTATARTFR